MPVYNGFFADYSTSKYSNPNVETKIGKLNIDWYIESLKSTYGNLINQGKLDKIEPYFQAIRGAISDLSDLSSEVRNLISDVFSLVVVNEQFVDEMHDRVQKSVDKIGNPKLSKALSTLRKEWDNDKSYDSESDDDNSSLFAHSVN